MTLRACLAILVAGASVIVLGTDSQATTRVVPDDFPTIQAAIDAAANSDTVAVRPGTYEESLALVGKDLVVRGHFTGFPTVVDNPVVKAPAGSRALTIGQSLAAVFREISFTQGHAEFGGGALVSSGSSCAFRGCLFSANTAVCENQGQSLGGALYVSSDAIVSIEDCAFRSNVASSGFTGCDGRGGAIYVAGGATLTARNVRFSRNSAAGLEGGWGGAVCLGFLGAGAKFEQCDFDSNQAGYGGAVEGGGALTVDGCGFRGNSGVYGESAITFYAAPSCRVTGSVFHDNPSYYAGTVRIQGTCEVSSNTLAFNGALFPLSDVGCLTLTLEDAVVRHNIVARNAGAGLHGLGGPVAGAIACNDVWANAGGSYGGDCPDLTGISGNFSADPAFCDTTNRSLGLRSASPCAPGGACGLVGALPVSCAPGDVLGDPMGIVARLLPVSPNPVRDAASLGFVLPGEAFVRLEIVDVSGRRIATLAEGRFPAGRQTRTWSLAGAERRPGPGVYFARLVVGTTHLTQALVVLQ